MSGFTLKAWYRRNGAADGVMEVTTVTERISGAERAGARVVWNPKEAA